MRASSRTKAKSDLLAAVAEPSLRCSVDKKHKQEECEYIDYVGIQSAVMHACEEISDSPHGSAHRPQEESVHDMGLFALPMDGGAEMYGYCLAGVFGDIRTEDGLENDADGI